MSHDQRVNGSLLMVTKATAIGHWHALIGSLRLISGSGWGILLADRPRGGRSGAQVVGDDNGIDDARGGEHVALDGHVGGDHPELGCQPPEQARSRSQACIHRIHMYMLAHAYACVPATRSGLILGNAARELRSLSCLCCVRATIKYKCCPVRMYLFMG